MVVISIILGVTFQALLLRRQHAQEDHTPVSSLDALRPQPRHVGRVVNPMTTKNQTKQTLMPWSFPWVPPRTTKTGNQKQKPLNILVLYPDDWRHDAIGGVLPVVQTPFLNQLATHGIRFTHNCVTTSICWVSRATYFTGQYGSRHESLRLMTPRFYRRWAKSDLSWPAMIQRHKNYIVSHVGKWQYANSQRAIQFFNWTSIFEGSHWHSREDGTTVHATDHAKDQAIRFLQERSRDHPFVMTVAFFPPKARDNTNVTDIQWSPKPEYMSLYQNQVIPEPYNMDDSWKKLPWFFHDYNNIGRLRWYDRFYGKDKYQKGMKNYYRLITQVDDACKEIVQELDSQGLLQDTMIIFTTDNGYFHGEHGLAGKWYPYQESIRVPLIIYDPRMPLSKRNTLEDSFTLNIDLATTILGAAGITTPHPEMQGRDIADLYLPPNPSITTVANYLKCRSNLTIKSFKSLSCLIALSIM